MKALRFDRFGPPNVLVLGELTTPVPGPGEVLVRIEAASINPSDVKNVAGRMEGTTLPRTPGRDFAGVIVEEGHAVWGTGGDVGFTRDGSHAEYIVVPRAGARARPTTLSAEAAGSAGVNFVTAWAGLVDAAVQVAGETVVVIGYGGVGSAVGQLARWRGARRVIAVDQVPPPPDTPAQALPDAFVSADAPHLADAVREATGGHGGDVVFNTVSGAAFNQHLQMLARHGRMVVIASVGARDVSFDMLDFYHNESRLIGVDSRALDTVASGAILDKVAPGFESGALAAPLIAVRYPLSEGVAAYSAVDRGEVRGKAVLTP